MLQKKRKYNNNKNIIACVFKKNFIGCNYLKKEANYKPHPILPEIINFQKKFPSKN